MAITSSVAPQSTVNVNPHEDADGVGADPAPTRGHIGRIVACSIIGGLVRAIVAVVGPFAGAQEHVITGSVLLVFATAWATLAVLSERWTDEPQRWAFVPAAIMGFTGVSILVLAPTGNAFGWVWPPVAAALAVWMFVRADTKSAHGVQQPHACAAAGRCSRAPDEPTSKRDLAKPRPCGEQRFVGDGDDLGPE
jgi:hypothetical protein